MIVYPLPITSFDWWCWMWKALSSNNNGEVVVHSVATYSWVGPRWLRRSCSWWWARVCRSPRLRRRHLSLGMANILLQCLECKAGDKVSLWAGADHSVQTASVLHLTSTHLVDMEDSWAVELPFCPSEPSSGFFAVFDGHGSRLFSSYCSKQLHQFLLDNSSFCESCYQLCTSLYHSG